MHALQALGLMDDDGVRTWDARPLHGSGSLQLGVDDASHPDDRPMSAQWWKTSGATPRRRVVTDEVQLAETLDWSPED